MTEYDYVEPSYSAVQAEAIKYLTECGFKLSPNLRIPIFGFILKLDRKDYGIPGQYARYTLELLWRLRVLGKEPKHKKGYYIN